MLVLNVLTGTRERWDVLSVHDKVAIVKHLRAIARSIEESIGGDKP